MLVRFRPKLVEVDQAAPRVADVRFSRHRRDFGEKVERHDCITGAQELIRFARPS
jgi:hypothetical protein